MEKLLSQLYVLRCIAQWRPSAHLAFLFYALYRKMYDNEGQNVELCEQFYGQWVYVNKTKVEHGRGLFYEKVYMYMKHNKSVIYHPRVAMISYVEDDCLNQLPYIVTKKRGSLRWNAKYEIFGEQHSTDMFNNNFGRVDIRDIQQIEEYRRKMEQYRKNAITEYGGVKFY